MNRTLRAALVVVAGALLVAAGTGTYLALYGEHRVAPELPFAKTSRPSDLGALRFQDGAGRSRSLADYRGKVVVLNLWATWCAPCREEMPALDRLHAALAGSGVEVIALSVDTQGLPIVRKFFAEVGVKSLEPYIDPSAQAAFRLNAVGLPSTLLVDAEGRELGRHAGAVKWDAPEIAAALRRMQGNRPVASGEKIYAQHCAACHGANLEGQREWRRRLPNGRLPAPPHDETGHTWHHPDEVLFAITRNGLVPPYAPPGYESDMPGFADKLSDDEIRAVLAFIASRWPPEVASMRAEMMRNAGRR